MDDGKEEGCEPEHANREPVNRWQMECQGEWPSTSREHCDSSAKGGVAPTSGQIQHGSELALYLSVSQAGDFGLGFYLQKANQLEIEGTKMVPPNERAKTEIVRRRTRYTDRRRHFLDEYNSARRFSDWRLGNDLERDAQLTKAYGCNFPSKSGITPFLRAAVFDWMTALGELLQIRSQGLHMAAWFVDHSEWSEGPDLGTYILRVLAALMMGDIATISRTEDKWNEMRHDLIVFAEHNFSLNQVTDEECAILAAFPRPLPYPTPHDFLLPFMISDDGSFPPDLNWGIGLCLYCFDLGLLCDQLVQYSSQFKCSAVVLLFRRILRSFCQCSTEELIDPSSRCEYHRVPEMTQILALQSQETGADLLRSVSDIYAGLLRGVQDFFARATQPGYECTPPRFEAASYKYSKPIYAFISTSRQLRRIDFDGL